MADLITTPDRTLLFITGNKLAYKPAGATPVPRVALPATGTVVEGAAGTLTVSLEFPHTSAITVSYLALDGTAIAGVDYAAASGTVQIPAGQLSASIPVTALARPGTQGNRTFTLSVVSAVDGTAQAIGVVPGSGAAVVSVTDAPDAQELRVAAVASVFEGETLVFRVTAALPVTAPILFSYATSGGTATPGVDYTATSGSGGAIAPGQTSADITVTTTVRSGYQGSRTVGFTISSATMGGTPITISAPSATGIIRDTETSGGNAYFDELVALGAPTVHLSWSLRDQGQLNLLLTASNRPSDYVSYSPDTDPAPTKQDAAKLYLPANVGQLPNGKGPRLVWTPQITSGKALFVYDMYVDASWYWGMDAAPDMRGNKSFRIHKQGGTGGGGWAHMWNYPKSSVGNGVTAVTTHDESGLYSGYAPGVISQEGFVPAGPGTEPLDQSNNRTRYQLQPNVWHRVWFEIRYLVDPSEFTEWNAAYGVTVGPNPRETLGRWHMLSKWIMRERDTTPQRLLYKVPVQPVSVNDFSKPPFFFVDAQIQFDTSQDGTGSLEKWAYFRNCVLLKDYALPTVPETDTFLFQAPVAAPA